MRVFSVPLSVPLLRTVIAALVDGRLVGFDLGAGRRSGAADGRHGNARRRLGSARQTRTGPARPILAALAAVPAHRAPDMAGSPEGNRKARAGGTARPPDRCGSRAP